MARGWLLVTLDPTGIRQMLVATNLQALAVHTPNRNGRCPICRVELCVRRIESVKWLRAVGVPVPILPPHPPRRPQWDCELCNQPWPCFQARCMLGDQYAHDRQALMVHMGALMEQARTEIQPPPPRTELAERFIAWTNPLGRRRDG